MNLSQLLLVYLCRSAHHNVLSILVHRERNNLADAVFTCNQHNHTVYAGSNPCVRRCAVAKCIVHSREFRFHIFFAQSKQPAEQDEVEAFQMGMVEMITRAEGMNSGLNQDQIIERAATQADQILARVDAASGQDAKNQIIWNWGPGMNACIDAVLN